MKFYRPLCSLLVKSEICGELVEVYLGANIASHKRLNLHNYIRLLCSLLALGEA